MSRFPYQTIKTTQKMVNIFGWDYTLGRECIHQIAEKEDVLVIFHGEAGWQDKIHAAKWYGCKWLFCTTINSPIAYIDVVVKDFQYHPIPQPKPAPPQRYKKSRHMI